MNKEVEFKFAVQDATAFDRLLSHLQLPGIQEHPTLQQTNHFFDTPGHLLRRERMSLRLREEAGQQTLTFKGGERNMAADGCATERTEIVVTLSPLEALHILQGELSALEALEQRVSAAEAIELAPLRKLLGQTKLGYIGYFKNKRTRLNAIELNVAGQPHSLCFELDTCSFAPGAFEYEIEVELSAGDNLESLRSALCNLLSAANIEWSTAKSKSQRFYARLAQPRQASPR